MTLLLAPLAYQGPSLKIRAVQSYHLGGYLRIVLDFSYTIFPT